MEKTEYGLDPNLGGGGDPWGEQDGAIVQVLFKNEIRRTAGRWG